MTGVKTVLPSEDTKPKLRMNVLRVIEEHLPMRLSELDSEIHELQKQINVLATERQTLLRIQEAAKN